MTAASADAKAIADRLYAAFNDSGFLGMGGTDEDAISAALAEAKEKGLMREVEALYAQAHPDEPRLKEELEDELSGDDLDRALGLYDEGMRQPPKPAPQPSNGSSTSSGTTGSPSPTGSAGSSSSPFNPVHGTLTPNTRKVNLSWEDFHKKYGMGHLFPPIVPTFTNTPSSTTVQGLSPTSPGGSAPGGSTPSLPKLPDVGKLLTWEADSGKLHVRIEIPKEASLKYPVHFRQFHTLECELKLAMADSGKASATVKLIGSPDFTATATIGVSNLKDPTLFAGLVFESTKSTHYEPNPEQLKKIINDTYAELIKLYDEYQNLETGSASGPSTGSTTTDPNSRNPVGSANGNMQDPASDASTGSTPRPVTGADPAKPAPPKDPMDKYIEQGKILGKMAGKIADMYDAFDKSRGTNGPEKGPKWNISLGANIKLDKSTDKPDQEKVDTLDLTFKAIF